MRGCRQKTHLIEFTFSVRKVATSTRWQALPSRSSSVSRPLGTILPGMDGVSRWSIWMAGGLISYLYPRAGQVAPNKRKRQTMKERLLSNRFIMRVSRLALVMLLTVIIAAFPRIELAKASMYDADMVERLQLTGTQKKAMQNVIAQSRAERDRIFRQYGIDPNARPQKSLLQRASSELMANAASERAAAKKILTRKQMYQYDTIIAETRQKIMASF